VRRSHGTIRHDDFTAEPFQRRVGLSRWGSGREANVLSRRVLLIGAGHAHLHVVRQAHRLRAAKVDLCLISPPRFRYSGLVSATLSDALPSAAGEIDVVRLAAAFGVEHLPLEMKSLDRDRRQVTLSDGAMLAYDALSLNIGSIASDDQGLGGSPGVWAVKPLSQLLDLKVRLRTDILRTGRCPNVVIAGGGQTGFEIAAALAGLCERHGVAPQITLVGSRPRAIWAPPAAIRNLRQRLEGRGVEFLTGTVVTRATGACQLASGDEVACDALVLAGGLVAPEFLQGLGLATDGHGRLRTNTHLQSVGDPRIFAAGDCAVIEGHARPCVGVFGVRAAPKLAWNLAAMAQARPLKVYTPQTRWLSIMDLGDGTGLALRGRGWWLGRGALRLKRRLDLGFVRRVNAPPRNPPSAGPHQIPKE
jgi:NADH dehydrogenase FAD-containing subunit